MSLIYLWVFALQEDALQFFKEERTDSAVYKLYLKKVRYHTPASDVGTLSLQIVEIIVDTPYSTWIPRRASIHYKFYKRSLMHVLDYKWAAADNWNGSTGARVCFVAFGRKDTCVI